MSYFIPVMLNCTGRRCVIVGGGKIAARKASVLIEAAADIVVISPALVQDIHVHYVNGRLNWLERPYQAGDLEGAFLVYAATNQPEVNTAVVREAEMAGIPVNDVSDSSQSSFITPASVRRGGLIVSVSTSGAGPAAARHLCQEIDNEFGDHYEAYIEYLSQFRQVIKRQVPEESNRRRLFKALMDMDILSQIREGRLNFWNEMEMTSWIDTFREE